MTAQDGFANEQDEAMKMLEEEGFSFKKDDSPAEIEEDNIEGTRQDDPSEKTDDPEDEPEDDDSDDDTPEDDEPEEKPENKDDKKSTKKEDPKEDDPEEDEERLPRGKKGNEQMPVWQHRKEMKKLRESLEGDPADPSKKQEIIENEEQRGEIIKKVEDLAKNHNADPELIKGIVDLVKTAVSVPADLVQQIQDLKAQNFEKEQELSFNSEFQETVLPLVKAQFPNIDDSTLTKLKGDLHKLAFKKGYNELSLVKIYKAEDLQSNISVKKKTQDDSKSFKARKGEAKQFDDSISEEDFNSMSDADIEQFSKTKSKGSGWHRA